MNGLQIHDPRYARAAKAVSSYDWYGDDKELDYAISECSRDLLPSSDGRAAFAWKILYGWALGLRFERDGTEDDMIKAKNLLEGLTTASCIPPDVAVFAYFYLARVNHLLYEGYGDDAPLHTAISLYEHALSLSKTLPTDSAISTDDVDLLELHCSRARCPTKIFVADKDNGLKALECLRAIIARRKDSDLDPLSLLAKTSISSGLRALYLIEGRKSDRLSECESLLRDALRSSERFRFHQYISNHLSMTLQERYFQGAPATVIQEAADRGEAVAAWAMRKRWLNAIDRQNLVTLGNTFNGKVMVDGILDNLLKASEYQRKALTGITYRTRGFAYAHMAMNLCITLCNITEENGDRKDADEAVRMGLVALEHFPDTAVQKAILLSALGLAHSLRYRLIEEDKDFEVAVSYLDEAAERCKQTDYGKHRLPEVHRHLSFVYGQRYKFTQQLEYLDQALEFGQLASDLEPLSSMRPYYLSEQGERLLLRYERTQDVADLDRSLFSMESALALTSQMRYQRHVLLARSARILRVRYELSSDVKDLDLGISQISEALDLHKDMTYIRRAPYLSELAAAHEARFHHQGQGIDLRAALDNYILASEDSAGAVSDRIAAAKAAATLAFDQGLFQRSAHAYGIAVSLLPRLAWIGMSRQRKLMSATSAGQLARNAAAMCIMVGDFERAVELLEGGRGVLWRSILELRTDLEDIKVADAALAAELVTVGQALEFDESVVPGVSQAHEEQRSQRRRRLAERWDDLVDQARQLSGFESFMRPAPYCLLKHAADEGPVVILNTSDYRTDALIMSANQPIHCVPMNGLPNKVVNALADAWQRALQCVKDEQGCKFIDGVLHKLCNRLWDGGFSDIAATLNILRKNQDIGKPFRVWLQPTGMFSLLPVHCARPHDAVATDLFDAPVYSYTTTLCTLINGRQLSRKSMSTKHASNTILGVSQPIVPGFPFLSHADKEIRVLAENSTMYEQLTRLTGNEATVTRLTTELPRHRWLHCCCHGKWDPENPLNSAFRMRDGDLTLSTIIQLRLQNAQFAVLSACHTARHTAVLPDESLHLAAGMQIAGFQGVLATQWAMVDADGPVLSRLFYDYLLKSGASSDPRSAAIALYQALQQFQAYNVPLYRWALFVHFGV
ncbi:hypothetical protein CALVIDRAFT_108671 [Calocera viscosa TUFC12733]|uniref:CHAT domain-containing protein n=1 Tax=Calocera viscosa (strain TUFC12733) TaxID=1330018 RepID=A0A167MDP7_CALVF|nr:hypothetical protein CALVIDRAFT_108671 [Calocera viscosa TUFC12733]